MKPLFLIFMLLPVQLLFAQTEDIPENIQSDFEEHGSFMKNIIPIQSS